MRASLVLAFLLLLTPIMGSAATATIIHTLQATEGQGPGSAPILYKGNLYGTTEGGVQGSGNIYRLYPKKDGSYAFVDLYEFNGTSDGKSPYGAIAMDPSGNLYGIALIGGTYGGGTAWELIRPANLADPWTFQVIWNFSPNAINGLVFNSGSLFGATNYTLFQLSPVGDSSWQYQDIAGLQVGTNSLPFFANPSTAYIASSTHLYQLSQNQFSGWDLTALALIDSTPTSPVDVTGTMLRNPGGTFYGISSSGGGFNGGTIFKTYQDTSGTWNTTVLRSFDPATETYRPEHSLLYAKGKYYGILYSNLGEVFQAYSSATSKQWTVNDLLDVNNASFGRYYTALTSDSTGSLYGASGTGGDTSQCGGNGCGVIWKITP